MQYFKGDDVEIKISGSAQTVFENLQAELTAWFNDAYNSAGLGAIIYDGNLVPLCQTMARDVFIKNYGEILRRWEYVGSFESYLYVFMQIFGSQTQITFEKLDPGALKIYIVTNQTGFINWLTKKAQEIHTQSGQPLMFKQVLGIENFYEVQGVLDSLNPAGIYLEVDFRLIVT